MTKKSLMKTTKTKRPRFVLRTIQHGCVTIFGSRYRPDESASRFNRIRAAFGLYYTGGVRDDKFVYLWGSEAAYRTHGEKDMDRFCEDGKYKWEWWNKVDLNGKHK